MAEKQTKLEIVIGAVDNATAKIKAIQGRINAIAILAAPIGLVGERLGGLAKEAGFSKLAEATRSFGGAVRDVFGKLAQIGGVAIGVVAGATLAVKSMIDEFDNLGDKAEAIGVSVDYLAQMRYAAARSGVEMKQLDDGMAGFAKSLGEARANKGPLVRFLGVVSPALLRQLQAAKSNEAAFGLLADAMQKIEDPAKRAALASKTLGNAALAPLLARGSAGIKELRDRYAGLAGPQGDAAAAAGKFDDGMADLRATTDGLKAAIVQGLAPALQVLIERLQRWFAANRARVAEFAASIGQKLPGAVDKAINVFRGVVDAVRPFVDSAAKLKVIAAAVAAVIVGPLVSAVYGLGAALLTTPVGWIIAGIAGIAAGAYYLIKDWDSVAEFFGSLWATVGGAFQSAFDWIGGAWDTVTGAVRSAWQATTDFIVGAFRRAIGWVIEKIEWVSQKIKAAKDWITGDDDPAVRELVSAQNAMFQMGPAKPWSERMARLERARESVRAGQQAKITVDFANAPRGTRVSTDPQSTADVDLGVGYQMGVAP